MTESSPIAGRLVIISGPSGVGKSTVVKQLIATSQRPLELSVSATTRPKRGGEKEGVNYHFLAHDEFMEKMQRGEFLEAIEVFGRGHWYGTLKKTVQTGLEAGKWIILEIDVEGAAKVIETFPKAITIFIHPGSLQELERRLRGRGTESEDAIQRRLEVARRELESTGLYQHIVENITVDQTVSEINTLLCNAED